MHTLTHADTQMESWRGKSGKEKEKNVLEGLKTNSWKRNIRKHKSRKEQSSVLICLFFVYFCLFVCLFWSSNGNTSGPPFLSHDTDFILLRPMEH